MKNTYIIIAIVLVVLAGVLLFVSRSNQLEAPNSTNQEIGGGNMEGEVLAPNTTTVTTTTTTTPQAVKEFTVSGKNFSFTPSTIKVKKGDRVKITFQNSQGFHDFVIDEYGVATKQTNSPTTEVLEFTADKTGSFEYYCSVGSHKTMGMVGTLTVE